MRFKFILTVVLFLAHTTTWATECELTDEYKQARKEALQKAEEVRVPFDRCKASTSEASFWMKVAACQSEGAGEGTSGGCQHLVGNGSYTGKSFDSSHCEVLKISRELRKRNFLELVSNITVTKCK